MLIMTFIIDKVYYICRIILKTNITMEHYELADALYSMKLGQSFSYSKGTYIRVPGGWIFKNFGRQELNQVFIPYSDEFNEF